MISTVLLVVLILVLLGGFGPWGGGTGYYRGYGMGMPGGIGLVLVIILILVFLGGFR